MAVHTHELTNSLVYAGPVMELAASMSDLPSGGQVLLGPTTFASITSRLAELGQRLSAEGAVPKDTQLGRRDTATSAINGLKGCPDAVGSSMLC